MNCNSKPNCYLIFADKAHGVTKTWSRNTNFDNSENWNVLRKPCPGDTVIFPANLRGAVYIGEATIGNEMVNMNFRTSSKAYLF